MHIEFVSLPVCRYAEDDGLYALGAVESVRGPRLNVDHHSRFDVDEVVVQFHPAVALQDVIHLGGVAVVVFRRVANKRDMETARGRLGKSKRARALAAFALDGGSVLEAADEVTLADSSFHGGQSPFNKTSQAILPAAVLRKEVFPALAGACA